MAVGAGRIEAGIVRHLHSLPATGHEGREEEESEGRRAGHASRHERNSDRNSGRNSATECYGLIDLLRALLRLLRPIRYEKPSLQSRDSGHLRAGGVTLLRRPVDRGVGTSPADALVAGGTTGPYESVVTGS